MAPIQHYIAQKDRPADLPDFINPPLIEVVLGVQFSELRHYRTFHAGLLWESKFRRDFPKCLERPVLERAFETFGGVTASQPTFQIVQKHGPVVPRLWFINDSETELVQVQGDRFLHNWRQMDGRQQYPRYEEIRKRFFQELADLESFLSEQDIGVLEPNQCEITYINHIALSEEDPWSHLDKVFVFFGSGISGGAYGHSALVELESGRFGFSFVIRNTESQAPLGRLHTEGQAANDGEGKPVIRLSLTARGNPTSPTMEGVEDFLNIGRCAIVDTFTAITTEEMHSTWGRTG